MALTVDRNVITAKQFLLEAGDLVVGLYRTEVGRKVKLPYKTGAPSPLLNDVSFTFDEQKEAILLRTRFYAPFRDQGRRPGAKPVPIPALLSFIAKRGIVPKLGPAEKERQKKRAARLKAAEKRVAELDKRIAAAKKAGARNVSGLVKAKAKAEATVAKIKALPPIVVTPLQLAYKFQKSIQRKGTKGAGFIQPFTQGVDAIFRRRIGETLDTAFTIDANR